MIRLLPLLLLLACAAPAALGVQVPEGEKIPAFTRRDGAGMGPARLVTPTDAPVFTRRYDDIGRLDQITRDGDTLAIGYDALGRLESIAGMGLTETRSDLDPARPHKLTGIALGGTSFAYAYAPENVVIGDPQNRLAQVDEADGRHVYTLAADGAREAEALQHRKVFDYNAFRQLRSIQELAPTGVETAWTDLKTDGFGRVTAYQSNAAHQPAPVERTLTWDAAGRLLSLSQSGATSTYAYNWRDQRVARTAPTLVAHYAWEDDGLLQEVKRLNGGEATTHPHLRGAGMTLAVGTTRLGHDHLGSPVLSVAAGIATPKTFDAWGRLTSAPPEISEISVGYTGHAYDAESGLTYAQARYYDPTLGLFLGPDPWEGDLSRPLSLGRFGYVEGNPATRIDPDGRTWYNPVSWVKKGGVAAAALVGGLAGSVAGCAAGWLSNDEDGCSAERVAIGAGTGALAGAMYMGLDGAVRDFPGKSVLIGSLSGAVANGLGGATEALVNDLAGTPSDVSDAFWAGFRHGGLAGALGGMLGPLGAAVGARVSPGLSKPVGDLVAGLGTSAVTQMAVEGKVSLRTLAVDMLASIAHTAARSGFGKGARPPAEDVQSRPGVIIDPARLLTHDPSAGGYIGPARQLGVDAPKAGARTWTRAVEFSATTTGRTYKVFQRADINWHRIRVGGDKRFIGKSNADAAGEGLRPELNDGSFATLHHSQQISVGPLFEASTRYHHIGNAKKAPLHPFSGEQHPHFPLGRGKGSLRDDFQRLESPEYWKWRVRQELGE